MASKKTYGLIMPKKGASASKESAVKKPSIFNDESSDDEELGLTDWRKKSLGKVGQAPVKKQTKLEMSRALEEDPTVFQYDEVYDAMEAEKVEKSVAAAQKKNAEEKKPRYIENLLKHAEIRKRENERRVERKVQKEREAEGDEFADKESFVTSAYRKKMEEMQKLEEEERRQEAMEEVLNVTKQKDMSGFYRHLYRQTLGEEKGQQEIKTEPEIKAEPEDDSGPVEFKSIEKDVVMKKVKSRSYRRAANDDQESSDDNSGEESGSESSSGQEDEEDIENLKEEEDKRRIEANLKRKAEMKEQREKREKVKKKIAEGATSSDEEDEEKTHKDEARLEKAKRIEELLKERRSSRVRKDVWKKVTVGDVYESAVKRYFERKSQRTKFP